MERSCKDEPPDVVRELGSCSCFAKTGASGSQAVARRADGLYRSGDPPGAQPQNAPAPSTGPSAPHYSENRLRQTPDDIRDFPRLLDVPPMPGAMHDGNLRIAETSHFLLERFEREELVVGCDDHHRAAKRRAAQARRMATGPGEQLLQPLDLLVRRLACTSTSSPCSVNEQDIARRPAASASTSWEPSLEMNLCIASGGSGEPANGAGVTRATPLTQGPRRSAASSTTAPPMECPTSTMCSRAGRAWQPKALARRSRRAGSRSLANSPAVPAGRWRPARRPTPACSR